MTVYGYLRVSTDKQDCDNQKIGVEVLAEKLNLPIENWIVDDDGNTIYFRSIVGALNYMSERGWKLVQPHTSVQSNILEAEKIESKTIWLLSKEVTSREEIAENINTRQLVLEQTAEAE